MRKLAVTGGLGSGKSTVCQILKESGAYVVDSDEIVRHLLTLGTPTGEQVIKLLGQTVITNHQIDRKKISNIVFSNPIKLRALELILHPAVLLEINRLFESIKQSAIYRFFVAEVPLLYEAQMENEFDGIIAVVTDENTARQRSKEKEEFDRRARFQLPQTAKESKATYVIKNDGDLTALKAQIAALIPKITL